MNDHNVATARTDAAVPGYQALVFKKLADTADFSCSQTILLPGQHTAADAWAAVYAALRAGGADVIGGTIQPRGEQLMVQ